MDCSDHVIPLFLLAAALAMSGVNYGKWLKYVLPYVGITLAISVVALTLLQSVGWALDLIFFHKK